MTTLSRRLPTLLGRARPGVRPCRLHSTSSADPSSSPFSSVNPDEVRHFDALASSWWDPHGPSRVLHLMNPVRHDFIRACRASQSDPPRAGGLRYLDVGCGGGIFAESAARLPSTAHVVAIDPSLAVLAVAQAHARRDPALHPVGSSLPPPQSDDPSVGARTPRLSYVQASVEDLPVPTSSTRQFDVVTIFEVLEHVESPTAVLARVEPFVRDGGWLVMSTIARTWMSWLTTKLVAEDLLRLVPRGTHDWAKYIDEAELRHMLVGRAGSCWGSPWCMGVVYVPGVGWKEVPGSEKMGNYFFAVRKLER